MPVTARGRRRRRSGWRGVRLEVPESTKSGRCIIRPFLSARLAQLVEQARQVGDEEGLGFEGLRDFGDEDAVVRADEVGDLIQTLDIA